jgi:hypothetical protein
VVAQDRAVISELSFADGASNGMSLVRSDQGRRLEELMTLKHRADDKCKQDKIWRDFLKTAIESEGMNVDGSSLKFKLVVYSCAFLSACQWLIPNGLLFDLKDDEALVVALHHVGLAVVRLVRASVGKHFLADVALDGLALGFGLVQHQLVSVGELDFAPLALIQPRFRLLGRRRLLILGLRASGEDVYIYVKHFVRVGFDKQVQYCQQTRWFDHSKVD